MAYDIKEFSDGVFGLYEFSDFLCSFKRSSFREVLEKYASGAGRSTNWVGSILHIFNTKFPVNPIYRIHEDTHNRPVRLLERFGEKSLVSLLILRGYDVLKPCDASDAELMAALVLRGYLISKAPLTGALFPESSEGLWLSCR